jgi:site-specific DNA-methyltransferase (adenine-specific)
VKPYYDCDGITIYHGDCREILPTLPKCDLLLTDPPYGLGERLHNGGTWSTNPIYDAMLEWDLDPVDINLLSMFISLCEKSIVWGGNYFPLPVSRRWLAWKKINTMPTMADFELAWCSFDGNAKQYEAIRNPDGKRVHPTQKPLALMRWCLSFAPDAKTILDPFMGSGTTLVAAKREGRKAVGIELEERYCEAAVKRLQQAVFDFDS